MLWEPPGVPVTPFAFVESMASQPPVPDSLAAVQSAASQEFATAYAKASGAPEGQADTPASPAAPVSEPAPPAATPAQTTAPTPPTPTTLDPSSWSPEARRSLEMEGWDGHSPITPDLVAKVAERKLEFNNRLADQARALKAGTPAPPEPAQAQPAAQPAAPAPQPVSEPASTAPAPTPPELDIAQVPQQVTAALDSDPTAAQMVEQYVRNDARLNQLNSELLVKAQQDYYYEQRRLEAPETKADPVLADETARRGQLAALTLERLLGERERLSLSQEALTQRYDRKASEVRARLEGQIAERVAATRRAEELARSWQPSLERVFTTAVVPPEQRPFIARYVADAFTARVREGGTVPDIEGFMTQTTRDALAAFDGFHRTKMGQYGAQAHARTDVVTPAPGMPIPSNGAPSPAPTTTPGEPQSLADLYRSVDRDRYRSMG